MILIIAEKPSVAKKIANALGKAKKKIMNNVPYYEVERDGKKICVASAVGHLFTLIEKNKEFGKYPVFDIKWAPAYIEKGKEYVKNYIDTLKELSKDAEEIYIATDYDLEGELIGYHALKYCCGRDKAKRMIFSSLTKKELIKAFENPKSIDYGLVDAGECRHIVDWYFGINLSRALMNSLRAVNRWKVLSVGRVQAPALSFLTEREKEIKNFKPKPYWILYLLLQSLKALHKKEKFWNEEEAKKIYNKIKDEKYAVVKDVKKTKKEIKPPVPYDLGTLQREAYSYFKISPKETQDIAQKLYEKGLCIHPETLILLPNGTKKIKELDDEGEILCLNNSLKLTKSKYKLLKRTVKEKLIKITLTDGTELITTKEHPILVYRNKLIFIPAEKLKENDKVVKLKLSNNKGLNLDRFSSNYMDNNLKRIVDGDVYIQKVKKIEEIDYEGEVYDLVVEKYHNFIANNIVVHNCSYPRTSSQKLPKDNEYLKSILKILEKKPEYSLFAKEILKNNLKPVEGKKDDAHPAIHVVDIPKEELSEKEKKIYDLIARRTLASFYYPMIREYIKAILDVKGEEFILSGAKTIEKGWYEIFHFPRYDEINLNLKKGEKVKIDKVVLEKKETQPPKRYTLSSIIKELEKRQLGTKSTRAEIIDKLIKRGYVKEENGSLYVTELGESVVETLKKFCPEIVDEKLTRDLEEKLENIQYQKVKKDNVLKETEQNLRKILEEFKNKEKDVGKFLSEKVDKDVKVVGQCECGGDLILIRHKKGRFISCSEKCGKTYSLPKKGKIEITKKKCEECGSPILKIENKEVCINPECPSKSNIKENKENIEEKDEKVCPKCGSKLIIKKGIYGEFYACPNYPKCKYTESIKEVVGKCPKCGSNLIIKVGKYGKFIGCENYPKCKYTEKIKK
ncbi:DNA topoisomerase I [Methanocaldococcus indicus]|uniref:DNA topoisomerase I n=1 Tax=Methanocaldococcus indicus TaxID=213231 RepID=UPI003C6D7736